MAESQRKNAESQRKMTDREKVIKRLEECLSASCRGFRTCPYSDNEWDAVEAAIALLREQEAVKPEWASNIKGGADALCGSCMAWLSDHSWGYCPRCGKAVKWE